LGACGKTSTSEDSIVSISHFTFDAIQQGGDPNKNPLCGRRIRARRIDDKTGQGASVDLTVVDRCEFPHQNKAQMALCVSIDPSKVPDANPLISTSALPCSTNWQTMI